MFTTSFAQNVDTSFYVNALLYSPNDRRTKGIRLNKVKTYMHETSWMDQISNTRQMFQRQFERCIGYGQAAGLLTLENQLNDTPRKCIILVLLDRQEFSSVFQGQYSVFAGRFKVLNIVTYGTNKNDCQQNNPRVNNEQKCIQTRIPEGKRKMVNRLVLPKASFQWANKSARQTNDSSASPPCANPNRKQWRTVVLLVCLYFIGDRQLGNVNCPQWDAWGWIVII